uniref:Ig-like domain-containing protein n=1 Tax=Timema cristinae TaxID=61476 RepID=A0A7R9GY96_TIMCR|nr:unnamed protein product [Timema cristinae]
MAVLQDDKVDTVCAWGVGNTPIFRTQQVEYDYRKNHPQFIRPRFEPRSPHPQQSSLIRQALVDGILDGQGPLLMLEPPPKLEFSNNSGGRLDCSARGSPTPNLQWMMSDGSPASTVTGLRYQLSNGTLVFPPFSAADFRPDVHHAIYRCVASNSLGRVISRDVRLRAGLDQLGPPWLFPICSLNPTFDIPLWDACHFVGLSSLTILRRVEMCLADRVDRAQEHLHFVMDIATDHLYVLDAEIGTLPQTPEDETAVCSPSGSLENAPDNFMVNRAPSSDEPSQETYKKWGHQSSDGAESDDTLSQAESPLVNVEEETSVVITPLSLDKDNKEDIKEDFNNAEEYNLEHNSNGRDGSSPRYHNSNSKTMVQLKGLHTQGYSLLSIDASGQTALHYGSRLGHKDIVKYLIACAPSSILNIADNDKGQTALHKAAAHKRRSICCMLVAGGASLSIADHQGNTPRHLALQAEDTELAAYLHSQEHFQLVADDLETVV